MSKSLLYQKSRNPSWYKPSELDSILSLHTIHLITRGERDRAIVAEAAGRFSVDVNDLVDKSLKLDLYKNLCESDKDTVLKTWRHYIDLLSIEQLKNLAQFSYQELVKIVEEKKGDPFSVAPPPKQVKGGNYKDALRKYTKNPLHIAIYKRHICAKFGREKNAMQQTYESLRGSLFNEPVMAESMPIKEEEMFEADQDLMTETKQPQQSKQNTEAMLKMMYTQMQELQVDKTKTQETLNSVMNETKQLKSENEQLKSELQSIKSTRAQQTAERRSKRIASRKK